MDLPFDIYSKTDNIHFIPEQYWSLFDANNIHFIWIGSTPSEKHLLRLDKWEKSNPKANVFLWTDTDLKLLPKGPWSDLNLHPAQRADLLRVWIIFHFGGWYVDIDCIPGRRSLPFTGGIYFAREDGRRFVNGFFYSSRFNPFLEHWACELVLSISEKSRSSVAEQTGPLALSRAIHTWNASINRGKFQERGTILQWDEFIHLPGNLFSSPKWRFMLGKFAVHFGESSWELVSRSKIKYRIPKQIFYLARHSRSEPIFEFIRLTLIRRLPPRGEVPFSVWRRVLSNADLAYIRESRPITFSTVDVQLPIDSSELVRNLSVQILVFNSGESNIANKQLGWDSIKSQNFDYLVRPSVLKIIP